MKSWQKRIWKHKLNFIHVARVPELPKDHKPYATLLSFRLTTETTRLLIKNLVNILTLLMYSLTTNKE